MRCQTVRKKLLLLLDQKLVPARVTQIQAHLAKCATCGRHWHALTQLWQAPIQRPSLQPSPTAWARLFRRIQNPEKSTQSWLIRLKFAQAYAPALLLLMIAGLGLAAGIHLGSSTEVALPAPQAIALTDSTSDSYFRVTYLDSFDDLPPESLGGIYATLTQNAE
jgi:anti-sigma factor RsiW